MGLKCTGVSRNTNFMLNFTNITVWAMHTDLSPALVFTVFSVFTVCTKYTLITLNKIATNAEFPIELFTIIRYRAPISMMNALEVYELCIQTKFQILNSYYVQLTYTEPT